MTAKHPRQRTCLDDHLVVRFVSNEIVEWLFEKFDMDDVVERAYRGQFGVEDLRQLTQLLGYSLTDYNDLSYAESALLTRLREFTP